MLSWRACLAWGVAATLAVAHARAEDERRAPPPAENAAAEAPYPHIYQAPLFRSLFAVTTNEAAVDESALRYYASLHNIPRANAEIKRLKALHPNWTPPTNIYSSAGAGADEQPFWDLLAADRIEELKAGVSLKEKNEPGWKPSRDLMTKVARKAAIAALVVKSNEKKSAEALAIADSDPTILHCAYMDADWRVADAFLDVGLPLRAFEIYHAIISICPDHDQRLATVRKSISRFSFDQTRSLIAMGAKSADGATEFDAAKIDLTRARLAALSDGSSHEAIEPEALNDFFAEIARSRDLGDLSLAGWFEYNSGRFDEAARWFALADIGTQPTTEKLRLNLAEGYGLALLKAGRLERALEFASRWRTTSKVLRDVYVGAVSQALTREKPAPDLPDSAVAAFGDFVSSERNVDGAQALGWYRYNRSDWDDAIVWFKDALVWRGVDPVAGPVAKDVAPEWIGALEGYGRALAHVGRLDEATLIADHWRNGGPALEAVFVNLMSGAIDAAPTASAIAPERLGHFADIAKLRQAPANASGLGWLYYRSADYEKAREFFADAISWLPQGRGALAPNQGLALSLKQLGRFADAEEVAWEFVRDSADMRAIYVAAVVAELNSPNGAPTPARLHRFMTLVGADRSSAGAQALGWYRLRQGNCSYAAPWFRRAKAWSAAGAQDVAATRGLALSLKAVGAYAEAEDLAYSWRDRDPTLAALYVDIGVEALNSEAPVIAMSDARVRRLSLRVLADKHVRGARALGWWRYRQAGCGYGGDWLRLAIDWSRDPRDAKTDEGYGLTLRATGRLDEAASVAWPWVDRQPIMKKLYIDVMVEELSRDNPPEPVEESRLRDFVATIEPIRSPLGAQALGWYRLERHELDEAARWFKQAIDWWPQQRRDLSRRLSAPVDDYEPILSKLALVREDYRRTPRAYPNSSSLIGKSTEAYVNTEEGFAKTLEGYALTLAGLGRFEEAEAIAWAWRDRSPALKTLFVQIAAQALSRDDGPEPSAERMARYVAAIEDARSAPGATAMAWRLNRKQAYARSAEWFEKALAWTHANPPDAGLVEGLVATLQADGKYEEAEASAAKWSNASPRYRFVYLHSQLRRMQASGKPDKMTAAKYQEIEAALKEAHSADAALSFAWVSYQTKDFARALDWFRNAADWGDADLAAKAKQGVALSLNALGRYDELAAFASAERDAAPVREIWFGGMMAWLTSDKPLREVPVKIRQLFEVAVEADRSVKGAAALAWGASLRGDPTAARRWFESAIAWDGFDPLSAPEKIDADRAKLVEGYALVLRRLGETDRAEEASYAWREAPALADLYSQIVSQAIAEGEPAPQQLARFAAFATMRRDAMGAGALGWRAYRLKSFAEAIGWFEKALAWKPTSEATPKLAEGYALALRGAGRLADAEAFAYSLASNNQDMRAIYLGVVTAELADDKFALNGARLDRFVASVDAAHSASGAAALGWRRLKGDNCVYAAPWFRKARAWAPAGVEDLAAARGLALSLRKAGAYAAAEDIAYAGREHDPEMDALYLDIGVEALTGEAPAIAMSEPRMQRLSERVLSARHVKGARALGWRRYRQAGCGFGGDWLRLAVDWHEGEKRDAKTDEGWGLTMRATGRLARAESVAWPWVSSVPLMKKLYIDVVVEELSRDNPPEPVDEVRLKDFVRTIEPIRSPLGAQALGWYRLERNELDDAARWFKQALDWWPPQRQDHSKRLSAPVEDYKPILGQLALVHEDYRHTPRAYPNSSSLIGKSTEDYVNTEEGLAKTEEGYAQTLRRLGRLEEAEAIAWAWRDRWPSLRALFLDVAAAELDRKDGPEIAPERLRRYIELIEADRSAPAETALAWRRYRAGEFDAAADAFAKAIAWTKARPPPQGLVQGYVLALQAAKKFDAAETAAAQWRGASPDFDLLFAESRLARLRARGGSEKITAADFAAIEKALNAAKSADGALSLAFAAYDAQDFGRALSWFRLALQWGDDAIAPKAKEGVALSLKALERYEELADFAYPERGVSPSLHDTYAGGMMAWLTSDKPLRDVKPEAREAFAGMVEAERNVDGAQALGWGALIRKDAASARPWFERALSYRGLDPIKAPTKPGAAEAKLVEGFVTALRESGDLARAEEVAYLWRDASANVAGLYLQIFTQALASDENALTDARVSRFAAVAEAKHATAAAGALGWRAYRIKAYSDAVAWFEKAFGWGAKNDAKIDEGYALALRAAGRPQDAEMFAWDHRAESRELRQAYVAAFSDQLLDAKLSKALSPARLDRFAEVVRTDKISAGASALGWRRLQDGNCGYSLGWFRKAIGWSAGARGDAKLYSGYAQALRMVGQLNEAEDAAFTFAGRDHEARELYSNIVIEELTRTWPRAIMSEARIQRFADLVGTDKSSAGAQALGWSRYGIAGCGYGARWFELAAGWSKDRIGDAKLNEGYALSLRSAGRLARAEALAYPWIGRAPAMRKLYIDIAVEELSRDYPPEPIPEARVTAFATTFAETRSPLGAQALGWYRFARGEFDPAATWFEKALDWWPELKNGADQKLTAPVDDYQAILARLAFRIEDYRRTPRAYPNSSLLIGKDTESYVDTEAGLAKTVEGYVRTLAALSRWEAAEALAFKWLDRWPPMRQILIDMAAAELTSPDGSGLSADRLARFVKLIEDGRSPVGAEALAWHAYKSKDFTQAARWFRSTFDWRVRDARPSLDLARAYADTLRGLKRYDDALAFISAWRDKMPDLDAAALDIGLDSLSALDPASPQAASRLKQLAASVSAQRSAAGAASLGWLAHGRKEFSAAKAWFRKAIEWAPPGGGPDPKALEGYARSLQGEGRLDDYMRFTSEWSARVESLRPLYLEAASQTFAAAAASGDPIATDVLAAAGKAFAEARSVDGAQALAWQRIAAKDWVTAEAWFKAARQWSEGQAEDPKTTEGLIIALRHLGRDDEAEGLAFAGSAREPALRDVYLEIVADRLTRKPPAPPDEAGMRRYAEAVLAASSANGAQALGWYSFNSRQYSAAAAWFEKSLAFGATEDAALGLAFAYRKLNDRDNYARVVSTYRETYGRIAALAKGRMPPPDGRAALESGEAPARHFRATLSERGASKQTPDRGSNGDMASGWRLLNARRPAEAARMFEAVLGGGATGRMRHDALYGRALALISLGETGAAGRAASDVELNPTQRNQFGVQMLTTRAWDAYNAGRYAEAISWLDRRAPYAAETRDLMQMRGWCLQRMGKTDAANAIEQRLDSQLAP